VQDLPDAEALQNIEGGFAELVAEVPLAAVSTTLGPVTVPVPVPRASLAPQLAPVKAKAVKVPEKPAKKAARKRA
jgi:hypothetical protein